VLDLDVPLITLINIFASHWNACHEKVPMQDIINVANGN